MSHAAARKPPCAAPRPSLAEHAQVAIVGGGPAGSAAAITLARAGMAPLVIERDAEPRDALCGGFLSWMTVARLRGLGVDPEILGAHHIAELAVFARGRSAIARLPAPAAGLSRKALDAALLARAAAAGARIERGLGARSFADGALRLDDGATLGARHFVLATGKHELRGCQRPRAEGDRAIGLRWRLDSSPRLDRLLEGRIELHLFRGGYAGLVRHEGGSANLCLAVRASRFAEASSQPAALLALLAAECPALADRIDAARAIAAPQAVANIPYGWRARGGDAGCYRTGDQAAVIPSFAGEGIAIALESGAAAAGAILEGMPAARYQQRFGRRLAIPFAIAGTLWHLAERPAGAAALVASLRLAPPLAGWAARRTRIAA